MTEKQVSSEKCTNCPNRSRITKLLARATRQNERAEGCEGLVTVSHGQIVTQIRVGNEPAPPQNTWNRLLGPARGDGERRYSRTDWTKEVVCGREPIEPRDSEMPYGLNGEFLRTQPDGKRFAAFIKGDKQELTDHYGMLGTIKLLDNLDEMLDAEDAGDTEGAARAQDKIAQFGFTVVATADRRGSKTDKSK